MELKYDASLDELTETSVRHLLRSKAGKSYRVRTIWSGSILCGFAIAFIFRNSHPLLILSLCVLGALLGGAINFFTYRWTIRRRIRGGIKKDLGEKLPLETVFRIDKKSLHCDCHGVTTTLRLADQELICEDPEYLEVSFGEKGTCLVPLRVFEDEGHKERFLSAFPNIISEKK